MSEWCIYKEYIIIWYNIQACCKDGYRAMTPGSDFSDHPSYKHLYFGSEGENLVFLNKAMSHKLESFIQLIMRNSLSSFDRECSYAT